MDGDAESRRKKSCDRFFFIIPLIRILHTHFIHDIISKITALSEDGGVVWENEKLKSLK